MINFIIYEDDKQAATNVSELIDKVYLKEHKTQINIVHDKEISLDSECDIAIIDIELDKLNGIAIAKQLQSDNPNIVIIFVSGYTNYFEDAYEVEHVYFLQKPVKEERLLSAIEKAENIMNSREKEIIINTKDSIVRLQLSKILYIESNARNLSVFTDDDVIEIKQIKLAEILDIIGDERLSRCHQSFIVNMSEVKRISGKSLVLKNDNLIPVSRKYIQDVKNKFSQILCGALCV